MNANPDYETLRLTLWIAAGLISVLLFIVAFFLSKQIKVQETLTIAVNQLTTAVTVIEKQQEEREPRTERRLNEHASVLDRHSERLTTLEAGCRLNHKK